jgi:ankyrin repeat protein
MLLPFLQMSTDSNSGFPSFGTCADKAEILDRGIAQLSLGNVELIDTHLHGAARCGDIPLIQAIVRRCRHESGFLEKENDLCQTPLLLACISGETSAALALLAAGAKATKPDHKGDTPLHWLHVLEPKDIPTLGLALLEGGAEINAISMRFEMDDLQRKPLCAGTPLHRAAAWNSLEASKFLLEHGADPLRPGVSNKLGTPLWLACTYHNYDVVRLILEHISKSDHVASIINDDETGDWPLLKPTLDIGYYYLNGGVLGRMMRHGENYQLAAETTFKVLKSNGATMKLTVVPALSQAIMLRSDDMVQVLLDLSPEMINTPGGPYQQPPLHFAVEQDRPDLVELVMSRGADTTSLDGHGLTALEHYCNHHGGLDIPRILLKKGLTFKLTPSGLPTPFFGAIRNGAFELARFILQNTPKKIRHLMINSPCCKSRNFEYQPPGLTILGYLILDCGTDTPRTVSKLFKLVAEFDEHVEFIVEPGEDRTALQGLVIFHPPKNLSPITAALCRELMKRSDSREQINHMSKPDRRTALWFAVNLMNPDLVAELLWRGADARLTDSNGVSAVDLLEKLLIHLQKSESHRNKGEERLVKEMERLFKRHGYL